MTLQEILEFIKKNPGDTSIGVIVIIFLILLILSCSYEPLKKVTWDKINDKEKTK
jgi:hypothetical protein